MRSYSPQESLSNQLHACATSQLYQEKWQMNSLLRNALVVNRGHCLLPRSAGSKRPSPLQIVLRTSSQTLRLFTGPKQQPESASNSTTTTALSSSASATATAYISKPPVVVRPVDYTGMSLKERLKLLDCVVERDAELLQWQREQDQQTENELDKMSRAEWEQWRIEFCKKHRKIIRHCGHLKLISRVETTKPTPLPRMTFEEVIESNCYSSGEDEDEE
jgi:hypothetical protein